MCIGDGLNARDFAKLWPLVQPCCVSRAMRIDMTCPFETHDAFTPRPRSDASRRLFAFIAKAVTA